MRIDGSGIRIGPELGGAKAPAERTAAESPKRGAEASALRSVLSPDELAYFAELERIGPVTYGPRASKPTAAPPPVLGQRIDVRG